MEINSQIIDLHGKLMPLADSGSSLLKMSVHGLSMGLLVHPQNLPQGSSIIKESVNKTVIHSVLYHYFGLRVKSYQIWESVSHMNTRK